MSQSLADIILHLVFSTKERQPWIKLEIEEALYLYISAVSRNLDCSVIKINGVEDHIHVLIQLGKTISVSKIVSEIKSNSSRWIKTKGETYKNFCWQNGYGVFSVSRSNLEPVKKYIALQKVHHKTQTYKEELIKMLNRAQVSFDEKYLWN